MQLPRITSRIGRHGKPQFISIQARIDPALAALRLTISDDGSGISPAASPGFGISGMRERAASAGGTLEVIQRPGQKGVTVVAMLPVRSSSEAPAPAELRGTLQ